MVVSVSPRKSPAVERVQREQRSPTEAEVFPMARDYQRSISEGYRTSPQRRIRIQNASPVRATRTAPNGLLSPNVQASSDSVPKASSEQSILRPKVGALRKL